MQSDKEYFTQRASCAPGMLVPRSSGCSVVMKRIGSGSESEFDAEQSEEAFYRCH